MYENWHVYNIFLLIIGKVAIQGFPLVAAFASVEKIFLFGSAICFSAKECVNQLFTLSERFLKNNGNWKTCNECVIVHIFLTFAGCLPILLAYIQD